MADILLTNDDGIFSDGIATLRSVLDPLGGLVTLAPEENCSAVARGITIGQPLRAREVEFGDGHTGFALDGTPADCVRAAVLGLFGRRPRVVVAGINLGANVGDDVAYSGTVAAVLEGVRLGLPGVAVSIESRSPSHLSDVAAIVAPIVERVMRHGLSPGTVLNVNLPDLPLAAVRGVSLSSLGSAGNHDRLVRETTQGGVRRYRIEGEAAEDGRRPGTDLKALADGYVSVTPLAFSLAGELDYETLQGWDLHGWLDRQRAAAGPPS